MDGQEKVDVYSAVHGVTTLRVAGRTHIWLAPQRGSSAAFFGKQWQTEEDW